jgi:hypothetical protein
MHNISQFLSQNKDNISKMAESILNGGGRLMLDIDDDGKFAFKVYDREGKEIPYVDDEDPAHTAAMLFMVKRIFVKLERFLGTRTMNSLMNALKD